MTIKRFFFRCAVRGLEQLCLLQGSSHCSKANLSLESLPDGNKHTDIITIAFNNAKIIPLNVEYVEKYYQDEHTHIIADNSSDPKCADLIQNYCEKNAICYIKLPKNHLNIFSGSYNHATALNWMYKHVIQKRKPAYFGIIDHDLFPIKPISLANILDVQHIYGPLRPRGEYWYLSAILSFFDFNYLKNKKVDFLPVKYDNEHYLDSGGGNWRNIYSEMDRTTIHFCKERMENFKEGNNRHQDQVEIFDDMWLHTINGSYWKKIDVKKENVIPDLIKKYVQ